MQKPSLITRPGRPPRRGFALVVTISLMVLLSVIGVGMLSLSAVSLRASGHSAAMAEARQNARLAAMMAIGQLQLTTGQDTRITADSTIEIGPKNPSPTPRAIGAWRSWEGSDRESSGKPTVPDYASKNQPGNPADPLAKSGDGRFLGWLTSTAAAINSPVPNTLPGITTAAQANSVPLVSSGSTTTAGSQVHMQPTLLDGKKGAMAWWVSGENSKALINSERAENPASLTDWQQRLRSNGRPDARIFDLDGVDALPTGTMLPSTATLELVSTAPGSLAAGFHDLTAFNRGLLTNTHSGGWRKDFSLMTENYAALPSSGLPFLTIKPGQLSSARKANPPPQTDALLYPWANYRSGSSPVTKIPPVASWDALVDYATQYRLLSSSSASQTVMPPHIPDRNNLYAFQERARRSPQLARIQWIYSLCSKPLPPDKDGIVKYQAGLLITPVFTLWNPHSVELTVRRFDISLQETAPLRFQFKVGTTLYPASSVNEITEAVPKNATNAEAYTPFRLFINNVGKMAPGESRVFSVAGGQPVEPVRGRLIELELAQGYRTNGGFLFLKLDGRDPNARKEIAGLANDEFSLEKIDYDASTLEGSKSGMGITYEFRFQGPTIKTSFLVGTHRMVYDKNELGGASVVDSIYPPLNRRVSSELSACARPASIPISTAIFGYRMAGGLPREPRHRHLHSKGMLQTNPLCYYAEVGFGDSATAVDSMDGTGVYHPINAPYDFAFEEMNGWNDSFAPQWESGSGRTYIVTGISANDGLTRCVISEVPTRPLQSLADLVHFDARGNNPIPPFQFNLIGNGSAHPVFAPDQISITTSYNNGMCNDDAYMLNHMLFDDWFFSSIAPDLRDFSATAVRTLGKVCDDWLARDEPLPNRFYLPARDPDGQDAAAAAASITSTAKDSKTGKFAFETVASKIEVEGMFNVNSVSLDAWKALLRQGRDARVPYLTSNGATATSTASSFTFPRTSVAGDRGTDSGSSDSGATFGAAAEFAGHRVLTDSQIDALAEEIVKQIKDRGPFLSLSEFVNRQLTSDKNRALAGTIQRALDVLAENNSSSVNPFTEIQKNAVEITSPPPGDADYKFPEAALGSSAFGVPGWIRQADILRPLAPLISVRDDTFTIRAYGDSRDKAGKITARAWCEVVVVRSAGFVDPSDHHAVTPHSSNMKSAANRIFGRRYEIASFRWLDESEV